MTEMIPATPPHGRRHDGSKSIADDTALLRAWCFEVCPFLWSFTREARSGGRPRFLSSHHSSRPVMVGAQ